jgi:hemerythrin-like domain-containing protein
MHDTPTPQTPDFSDPLAALHACHEDMLAQCETLEQLVAHIREHGLDAEARGRIAGAVQFFTTVAVQHHQDEETDLFPILNRQSLKLADIVFRLRKDHEQLHKLWDTLFLDFKKGAALAEDDAFADHVTAFCSGYRDHIKRETMELLNMAQHILSHQQLEEIGRAMARRRGIRR